MSRMAPRPSPGLIASVRRSCRYPVVLVPDGVSNAGRPYWRPIRVPAGWRRVAQGHVRRTDREWYPQLERWGRPRMWGAGRTRVGDFTWAIIRRVLR